jgi:glucose/mannose-6-phosphate isomerase
MAASAMLEQVLAMPDHLRDAPWRVETARVEATESAGLLVCGMGGSAIGGDLAAALLGERLSGPMTTVRDYRLPGFATSEWTVLCSSYSGQTEETLACFEAASGLGARLVAVSTGGALVERARETGSPVVGLPGILQPRAAVAYMTVAAAEVAALAGIAPRIGDEVEDAAASLEERAEALQARAAEVGAPLAGTTPVVIGAELTAPVARRWKTQINENAKLQAFFSELPEADHNEICGWAGASEGGRLSVVTLEDAEAHPRVRRRFELTAEAIADAGVEVVRVEAEGDTRAARMFSAVMLGDLVSLRLAEARGADPLEVDALDSLKDALARS